MAKQQRFQRKVDKNGKVYYNELKKDSNGITRYVRTSDTKGAKAYIDKNFDSLKNNYTNLTDKEKSSIKRSKAQKELFRWDGKPIKKEVTDFLIQDGSIIKKNSPKELTKANLPNVKRPSDLEREFNFLLNQNNVLDSVSKWGATGFRKRIKSENIVSIKEEIDKWLNQGFVLEVNDLERQFTDIKAWNALKQFEINVLNDYKKKNENVAMVKFDYKIYIDEDTKRIVINLSETKHEPFNSDPKSRQMPKEIEDELKKKKKNKK
jgi:hypothetical protein